MSCDRRLLLLPPAPASAKLLLPIRIVAPDQYEIDNPAAETIAISGNGEATVNGISYAGAWAWVGADAVIVVVATAGSLRIGWGIG